MESHKLHLEKQYGMLNVLFPFENTFSKISQIGIYMKLYYLLVHL